MIVIFVVALLIFGPRQLPELGRTLGKALTEFRRASSELKSTLDREMSNLEQATEFTTKELTSPFDLDANLSDDSTHPNNTETASVSAPQDAQLTAPAVDGSLFVEALYGNPSPTDQRAPKQSSDETD